MIRILSLSTLFPSPERPTFGKFVANQMAGVASRGDVEVTMVNPVGIPPWPLSLRGRYSKLRHTPSETTLEGMRILHPQFTTIPKIGGDGNPGRIAEAIMPLARRLHAEQPFDIVDAQFFFPDGPAAARIAADLGVPLTIKARGSDIHYWGGRPRALEQMLGAARQADRLLAVSYALRSDMARLGMAKDKIAVHYTGLDRSRFKVMDRAAARALVSAIPELGVWTRGPLIVTPGSLIQIKGQRLVIGALPELEEATLAIAGTGEDEQALRAHAKELGVADRVQFLGHVSHDVLPQLFSAANVVALPSEREGLANVWIEAMACGAPLVIPDIGGAVEVVTNPGAGRIAAREPHAIASAIREILEDQPDQDAVAQNVARFCWETNAAEIVEIWRALAHREGALPAD